MADGSIDQLNYEIILKDNGFETKLKELEALAKSFNTNMSTALTISKIKDSTKDMANYSKAVKEAAKGQKDLNDQMKAMPASKVRSFSDDLRRTNKHLINTSNLMRNITQLTGVYFGAMGVRRFLSSLIEVTGQFEVQRMALRSMLQDADKADRIFGQFRQLALQSPYTFQEFAKFGKQLTAFNIPAENLVDTTKMLADVAAGLGVDMQRIILAYGQIKSAGVLKGTELRQLTEAGVPILDQLAKQIEETTGKTVQLAEVFDMIRKKQISFEMVEQAFREMTAEGGKFYNMQEVLVETLQGKIGKLKDVWQQALYDIGMSQEGILKGSVDLLTNIVANYDKLGRVLLEIVAGYGAYRTVLFALTAVSKGYTIAQAAQYAALLATEKAQKLLNTTLLKNPYAIVAAAFTALAVSIYKLAAHQSLAEKTAKELANAVNKAKVEEDKEVATLDKLSMKLSAVSSDTDEWKKAKSEVIQQFGKYSDNLDEEITKVGNLSTVYSTLRKRIAEAAKVKMYQSFIDTQTTNLTQISNSALDNYIKGISEKKLSQGMKDELLGLVKSYVYGGQALTKSQTYALSMSGLGSYLEQAKDAYTSLIGIDGQARKAFGITDEVLNGLTQDTKNESEELKTIGNSVQEIVENIETLKASIKGTRDKAAKGLGLTDEEIKKLESDEAALNNYMNRYKLVTGRSYEGGGGGGGSTTAAETEEDKRIAAIKKQIELLRKYKETYESFSAILGEDAAKDITNQIYKTLIGDFDFDKQFEDLVDELRKLGDEEGAESLLASLGLKDGSKLLKRLQDVQRVGMAFRNLMEAWTAKDMDADDDTFMGKMVKIVSDLKTKSGDLFNEYQRGIRLLRQVDVNDPNQKRAVINAFIDDGMTEEQANEFWDTFISKGEAALTKLYADNLAKIKTNAQRAVNELADEYVKDKTDDLDLSGWGRKPLDELYKTWKDLRKLVNNNEIPKELEDKLTGTGLKFEKFKELVEKAFSEMEEEARKKLLLGVAKYVGKTLVNNLSSVIDGVKEFAEATGNAKLANIAEDFSGIAKAVEAIAKGYESGNWVGAMAAGITSVISYVTEAETKAAQLKSMLVEARREVLEMKYDMELSDNTQSIFGDDDLKRLENAKKVLNETGDALDEFYKKWRDTAEGQKNNKDAYNLLNLRQKIGGGEGLDGYDPNRIYAIELIAAQLGMLENLYDEYGHINLEVLQTITENAEALGMTITDDWNKLLVETEAYNKALEQVQDVMESVFGSIASSAADTIVDGWIEAKNAALDYSDILDDVAQSYSKMLVKSMVLDVLKDDESLKKITDAFVNNDTEKAMALIEGKMQEVAALEPAIQQVLQAFDPYFKREDTERQGLSKGIESNFSQDTIDYWSGQLTLLVEYAHRGDEQRIAMNEILVNIRDAMAGTEDGSYAANVQTYLATIQSDTSSIRADISSMRSTLQYMSDHGVRAL